PAGPRAGPGPERLRPPARPGRDAERDSRRRACAARRAPPPARPAARAAVRAGRLPDGPAARRLGHPARRPALRRGAAPARRAAGRVVTAAALALALVLHTADGHLARLQGTASEFGRWLDAILDELGDMALHAAAAWAAFHRDAQPAWLLLGMLYAMGKYLFQ